MDVDVVVVGGGAAGIAAARELAAAKVSYVLLEARPRLGGRAWTVGHGDMHLDLGCGWLHSADRNPLVELATSEGFTIDRTEPPWHRSYLKNNFPPDEQAAFKAALRDFFDKVAEVSTDGGDRPASDVLPPGAPWNPLVRAVGAYYSGADPGRVSLRDLANYQDSDVNWRVCEGYGAAIAMAARGLNVWLQSAVTTIDHSGRRLRIETTNGAVTAERVIITLPSNLLARDAICFTPSLPDKRDAAAALPLGVVDKLFIRLEQAEEFPVDTSLVGNPKTHKTGDYNFRPFGLPVIQCFFAGELAQELERAGPDAPFDFAVGELAAALGSDFAGRLRPMIQHQWGADPFAGGSYSYAVPGAALERPRLAAPVDDRIFFAGEACSSGSFSTAHGAWATGIEAARRINAVRATRAMER